MLRSGLRVVPGFRSFPRTGSTTTVRRLAVRSGYAVAARACAGSRIKVAAIVSIANETREARRLIARVLANSESAP